MQGKAVLRRALAGAALAIAMATLSSAALAASPQGQVWLVLSDIHLDPFDSSSTPSGEGFDTNVALFDSAIAQMKRSVPDPAVILLPGDLLAHHFARIARRSGQAPDAAGLATMRWIARRLNAAFPRAQFAIALGNNDTPCGDYESGDAGAYQSALARIWAPLVDKGGASPRFAAGFAADGYYTARLPLARMRLVVLDAVPLSFEYRGNCGPGDRGAAQRQLDWLAKALVAAPGVRNVVMTHIPPGYDAFSTDYIHGLVAWPFLRPQFDRRLVAALRASRDRVAYVIAGHTHRFDFRLAGGVPVIVVGSVSPIYGNAPAFYALHLSPDGALRDIETYPFDESRRAWVPPRSFDRVWDVRGVAGTSLQALHERLSDDGSLRAAWDRQAAGWPSDPSDGTGTWRSAWRLAWCAQDLLVRDYPQCAEIEGRAWLALLLAILAIAAAAASALAVRWYLRARGRKSSAPC